MELLRAADIGGAATLDGSVGSVERARTTDAFARDELEFLLLGPEQLANDDVLEALVAGRPSLFVVDEAHCVSEWGPTVRFDEIGYRTLDLEEVVERGLLRPASSLETQGRADATRDA